MNTKLQTVHFGVLALALLAGCGREYASEKTHESDTSTASASRDRYQTDPAAPADTLGNPAPTDATHASTPDAARQANDKPEDLDRTQPLDAQSFVTKACGGGMFEVQSADFVIGAEVSAGMQRIAERLRTDHAAANERLEGIARDLSLETPSDLPSDKQQLLDKLKEQSGDELERTYLTQQIEAHKATIEMFESAGNTLDEDQLASFARDTLPTLRNHLELLKSQQQVKDG